MYPTTQKFKDTIYAPVRRTTGRVTFDISDTTANGDVSSITVTSESPLSVKAQLINKVRNSTYKTATLEQDRFKLDGSFSFPDDTIANNGELGWSSAVICDSSGSFSPTGLTNFVGKVSGSVVENPNVSKRGEGSSLLAPSGAWTAEHDNSQYNSIATLNGSVFTKLTNANLSMGQTLFSFNLISYMLRTYGMVVDVAWLKANVTSLTYNWWGYGSSPTGNNATTRAWNGTTWVNLGASTTAGIVTKLTATLNSGNGWLGTSGVAFDSNGFVNFIAYADASDGTTASTINTDYVELLISVNLTQTLTFNFTSNHSSAGLTITFDEVNGEYATDFDMTAYNSVGGVIATVAVTGNTDIIATPFGQLLNYRSVSVVIKKWSVTNRRARVFEVDFGVVKQYTDDSLISMNLIDEMDMLTGKVPSPEFKFTIDNVDRAFNILNPNGFYKYLQQKQQIIAEIGLETTSGYFEYVPLGNYLLQEWKSDQGSITATFTGRTNLDSMASFDYENLSSSTKTLYQFAVDMFTLCGITNYSIDTALQSINTNSLVKKANCRDILQMIAIAGCANIYVTRGNIITIKANRTRKARYIRDWVSGSSANTSNHWIEIQATNLSGSNLSLGKDVTFSSPLNQGTASLVTDGDTTSTVYAGINSPPVSSWAMVDLGSVQDVADVKVWHYWADFRTYHNTKTEISEDGVTWSTVFDSAVSGEYAESSTGRTYSLETVTIPLVSVDTADFDNMYNEPQIALDKAIKRVEITYWTNLSTSSIVGVNSTTDTLGDTLKLENNTLINDSTRATAVANWFFAQLKYRATYKVNWRGNPATELNDVMSFENSYGADMSAYITRYELDYLGYLTARMQAKGAVN